MNKLKGLANLKTSWFPAVILPTLVGLSGCASLPSQGPSASEIVSQAGPSVPGPLVMGYDVVDVDQRVVDLLKQRVHQTLTDVFDDRSSAPVQMIGVGDGVTVTIWEAAEGGLFTSPVAGAATTGAHSVTIPQQVVASDGSITVPFAGRIRIAGKTPSAVEKQIVSELDGKALDPQVLVSVGSSVSNTVTVLGEVTNGARIPLSPRGDRVMDVIASAGGIRSPIYETFITLTRRGRSVTVPMQALIANPQQNIFVRPGDELTLQRIPQSFTAFGATGHNAMVPFDAQGISLSEAIAKAGGLLDTRSDPSGIFVFRPEPLALAKAFDPTVSVKPGQTTVNVIYRLNLRQAGSYFLAGQFSVLNKDTIYVAGAPLNDLQKFLQIISLTTSSASVVKDITN